MPSIKFVSSVMICLLSTAAQADTCRWVGERPLQEFEKNGTPEIVFQGNDLLWTVNGATYWCGTSGTGTGMLNRIAHCLDEPSTEFKKGVTMRDPIVYRVINSVRDDETSPAILIFGSVPYYPVGCPRP